MAVNNNLSEFQSAIKAYLDKRSAEDSLFATTYAKENKNIKDCCTYITGRAKKEASNGCAVISDEVVFGWAVHYYDEDDIKVGKPINGRVVVNHTIELTAEEKEQARKDAIKKLESEELAKLKKKAEKKAVKRKTEIVEQPSLFD